MMVTRDCDGNYLLLAALNDGDIPMVKHPRKRQKTSKAAEIQPLGSTKVPIAKNFHDDDQKDDEELQLESMLFGKKFVSKGKAREVFSDEEDEDLEDGGGRELQHLVDNDLFFVDDGEGHPSVSDHDNESDNSRDLSANDDDDDASDGSSPSRPATPKLKANPSNPLLKSRSSRKPPAWEDPSDRPAGDPEVPLSKPITRKLRDSLSETSLTPVEYEKRLRRQWERINPLPQWAADARSKRKGRKPKNGGSDADEEELEEEDDSDTDISHLLNTTSGILSNGRRKRNVVLKQGPISLERLRDANQSTQDRDHNGNNGAAGEAKVVLFHPNEKIPLLCVGTSGDRRVRLFNIDGHTNPLLQTLHVPSLPITSPTSVAFHPGGTHLLLTGPRPFFYTHDLQSGKTSRHARGLWGTTFALSNDTTTSLASRKRGRQDTFKANSEHGVGGGGGKSKDKTNADGMELTAFDPYSGEILAVAGRAGYVHLVDWKSGSGQVIGSLKCGSGGGGVRGLWWIPPTSTFSDEPSDQQVSTGSRTHLAVLSGDAEVYIWDVGERRCVKRWKDEGGFRGAGRVLAGAAPAIGNSNGYDLAVGSNSGYVNVYDSRSFTPTLTSTNSDEAWGSSESPKPLRAVGNLTTAISTLRFNHDAQILAMASKEKKDSMRLVSLPPCRSSLPFFFQFSLFLVSFPLGHNVIIDDGDQFMDICAFQG
ncbi:WD40 repeat-like protein [Pluteus cervinus]|uniref:WD40 repeat-like protein n=1 Tax=Pluteus cervinus TaxID=181527 RepID=A0ACD3ARE3_9AGAR|nr:WD40 repeat-like protein [Pluteus cervinus]